MFHRIASLVLPLYLPCRYSAADGTFMGLLKVSNKHTLSDTGMEYVMHACSSAPKVVLLVDESRMACEAATSMLIYNAQPHQHGRMS